ncbi:sensor histidine kinase [Hamadaea tsunoensis]|uniref:sensor histidine kinase n=1 Tax=Hamadaea tsunoensis TaxID=53368 RepID=UPI00040C2634|nr:sensor histidine kinase [Hamadaea tsunoensis]
MVIIVAAVAALAALWTTVVMPVNVDRYVWPVAGVVAPALLLRRFPKTALTIMLLVTAWFAFSLRGWQAGYLRDLRYITFIVIDLAIVYLAVRRPRVSSVVFAVSVLGVQLAIVFIRPIWTMDTVNLAVDAFFALLIAWTIGSQIRQRRAQAEHDRARAAERTMAEERQRIAREVHDMVAHSIGIIAIQAGVGRRVIDTRPDAARDALDVIEATSRQTLAGLRRTLGTLRQADGSASLDPLPGLADLDRLAEQTERAGVRVSVVRSGEAVAVPGDIDLSAYRIVQEALTNVVRHAGVAEARVALAYGGDALTVEIVDDGCGGQPEGSGFGLAGMRERVALLGGEIEAGPRDGKGFRVFARIPLSLVTAS